jgi:hypothetical protein
MEDVTSPTGKPRRRPAKSTPAAQTVPADEPTAPKKRTRAAKTTAAAAKTSTAVVKAPANTADAPAKSARERQPRQPEPNDLITELDRVLAEADGLAEVDGTAEVDGIAEADGAAEVDRQTLVKQTDEPAKAPLWAMIVADPGFTSEHAAREAVRRAGGDARDWVAWVRARYPGVGADAIARLAAQHYATIARRHGAGTAAAGLAGSVAGVGDLARIQARLVLTVAAAYGADPTSMDRARELLELMRIPRLTQPTLAAVRNGGRLFGAVLLRRVAAALVPLGGAIAGAVHGGRSTDDLAMRAVERYRNQAQ